MNHITPNLYQFRLSSSQRSLWFAHQLNNDAGAYNVSYAWQLHGALKRDALECALNDVVARHEILRTNFKYVDDLLVQEVRSETQVPLILTVWANKDDNGLNALVLKEAQRPFDLGSDLLIRAQLFQLADDKYIFLMSFHHIVIDGWSMSIMWSELGRAYDANRTTGKWTPSTLSLQYGDYAEWQSDWLNSEHAQAGLNYWRSYLSDANPSLILPSLGDDIGRDEHPDKGNTVHFSVLSDQLVKLRDIARQHRTTLFVVLSAALNALLHRLNQQNDLCIGYAVANRRHSDTQTLIGCFVNTLVLRSQPHPSQTFGQLIEQVRESVMQGEAYQETPFEQIVETLHPDRTTDGTPLFEVMFSMEDRIQIEAGLKLSEVVSETMPLNITSTKFKLCVNVKQYKDGLAVELQYDQNAFTRSTVERTAGHFVALLEDIARRPSSELRHLALTKPGLKLPMSIIEPPIEAPNKEIRSLVQAFETQVEKNPHAVALISENGHWSYAQLNKRANKIADYLRKKGVAKEDIVAVLLNRSGDLVAAFLGILKAGGAYLPLDPLFPAERMLKMLAQSNAKAALTTQELSSPLDDYSALTLRLDTNFTEIDNCSDVNLGLAIVPDQLAYCVFTSGSTGQPKGVLVEHHALANMLRSMSCTPGIDVDDVWLSVTSPTFDVFGLEIYLPLISGATIVLPCKADACDPAVITELVKTHGVKTIFATPVTWRMLSEYGRTMRLRTALCGGETMDLELSVYLQTVAEEVWNLYGPTETTVLSTRSPVRDSHMPVLGNPIGNTGILILDNNFKPLPVGVAGEIYITGSGLARGYVNRPDLTAERFLACPYDVPGSRMYRTGDMGYIDRNGSLVYFSRIDSQVKIRGFRIELSEVEAALRNCPQVRDAVVLASGKDMANRRLVGYVVARYTLTEVEIAAIRQRLAETLPSYMIPNQLELIPEIPINANGKVDRRALPMPKQFDTVPDGRLPTTPTEICIAGIWAIVLGVENLSIDDNFFSSGGNSMLALRCLMRLNDVFKKSEKASLVFKYQTIATLANAIDNVESQLSDPEVLMTSWFANRCSIRVYGFPAAGLYGGAYFDLANALMPQVDFCILEPVEFDSLDSQSLDLGTLAQKYVHAFRDVHSPICLLGHSFGGSVAYEVARLLEQEGKTVKLILLDSTLVNPKEFGDDWDQASEFPRHFNHASNSSSSTPMDKLEMDAYAIRARYWKMLTLYTPSGQFGGNVLILFARDDVLKIRFESLILARCRQLFTGEIRTASTPGEHLSILHGELAEQAATLIKNDLKDHWTLDSQSLRLHQEGRMLTTAFDGLVPAGCVVVEANDPDWWNNGLLAEEQSYVAKATTKRRREFSAGRNCARAAMKILGMPANAIAVGSGRQPMFPLSVTGSITHTGDYCAAAVHVRGDLRSIGIDAETDLPMEDAVARRVLSPSERARLNAGSDQSNVDLLAFSLKEAFYKAAFPFCQRLIGFEEIAIRLSHGKCKIELLSASLLAELSDVQIHVRHRFADGRVYSVVTMFQRGSTALTN